MSRVVGLPTVCQSWLFFYGCVSACTCETVFMLRSVCVLRFLNAVNAAIITYWLSLRACGWPYWRDFGRVSAREGLILNPAPPVLCGKRLGVSFYRLYGVLGALYFCLLFFPSVKGHWLASAAARPFCSGFRCKVCAWSCVRAWRVAVGSGTKSRSSLFRGEAIFRGCCAFICFACFSRTGDIRLCE